MDTKKCILHKNISKKTLFTAIMLCFVVLLLPMLYIARYDVPSVDDFSNGAAPHHVYMQTGSIAKVIEAAGAGTARIYNDWQGTYSAVFLMHIQPAVFGEQFYPITAYLMLASLLGGLFLLCYTVFGKVFGAEGLTCGIIATAECILCTQFVPSPGESFYWFNGSVYYTFFFGVSLICYALIIQYICLNEKRKPALGLGIILLLIFIGGGNYSTALLTAELLFLTLGLLLFQKNGKWKDLALFFVVFMLAFLISILAPGNAARGGLSTHSAVLAILQSFKTAAAYIVKWTTLPVVALAALLVPICLNFCGIKQFDFRLPAFLPLLSFCLLASMFSPPLYAQGYFAGRLLNIVFFAYIFLLVFNVFYWAGWATGKVGERTKKYGSVKLWFAMTAIVLFTVGSGLMCASGNVSGVSGIMGEKRNVTSAYAMVSLLNGGAKRYYDQTMERLTLLEDESLKEVELQPFDYRPGLLFVSDISADDCNDWRNVVMCAFYGKDKVWLSEPYSD